MAVCFPLVEYGCMFSKGLASKLSYSLEGFNESPYGHSFRLHRCKFSVQAQLGENRCAWYCTLYFSALVCAKTSGHKADLTQLYPGRGKEQMSHTKNHTDPMDRLCCVPGRSSKCSQACHQPLVDMAKTLYHSLCLPP